MGPYTKGRIKFNQAKKAAILIRNEASILIPKKEKEISPYQQEDN